MRVFLTQEFARYARRERISDRALCAAINRAERGLIDADLEGGVIKQRVPRQGQGCSGGYRTLIAYRLAERSIFLHVFAKSDQENVSGEDLAVLKATAREFLTWDEAAVQALLDDGAWKEIDCDA